MRIYPMNTRRTRIYEGKAKILYEGPEPGTLVVHYKDDATAFNAQKKAVIEGKGVINNRISEFVFTKLNEIGLPTHFIRRLNMREQLIREVEIIPIEVVVRNIAAGSLATRLGMEEGTALPRSIIEFYYKNDELGDPMISEEHITAFNWATPRRSTTSWRCRSGSMTSCRVSFSASASSSSTSSSNSAGCMRARWCAPWWPTRSRRTTAGCGTSNPATSSTRTGSAATWAAWSRPIRRWRAGSGSFRTASSRSARARCWSRPTRPESAKARITITLKNGVLDPQGKAIEGALHALGFAEVANVRQGKLIELDIPTADDAAARNQLKDMCEKLLANTVIENYNIEIR